MEEMEEGMSLGEIFSLMFKKKLILLITTLVVAVIGIVGILAIYNPSKKITSIEFYYSKTSLADGKYADGNQFVIQDVISKNNVDSVIASNEDYKVLDAETVYNDLSISTVQEIDEEKKVTTYYKVSILSKRLKNSTLAKNFLIDLVNMPIKKDSEIITGLDEKKELKLYEEAKTYEDAFDYIAKAYNSLETKYKDLISRYGDQKYTDKDKNELQLSKRLLEIQDYYKKQNLDSYLKLEKSADGTITKETGSIINYGFILDYDFSRQSLQNELNRINDQIDLVESQINSINEEYERLAKVIASQGTGTVFDQANFTAKVTELTLQKEQCIKNKEKVELKLENENSLRVYYSNNGSVKSQSQYDQLSDEKKALYNSVVVKTEKAAIKAKLDATKEYLSNQFDLVNDIQLYLIDNTTLVYYQSNKRTQEAGGLNSILAILISVLVGLVIGCIISFALSYSDFKAKKELELNQKEEERIKKEISYRKMLKENGVEIDDEA